MRIKEFTGKTTQEAIDNGLAELGVTIADVHVDVLQEGAKGLFGLFGSKPACVRLTVMEDEREDDHGLSDLLGSFSLNEQKKKGVGVLFIGEDLDVLLELCDKILVLCAGKVSGLVDARTTTKEEVGMLMTRLGGKEEN